MPWFSCLWPNRLSSAQCGTTSRRDLKGNTKVEDRTRQSCSPVSVHRTSPMVPRWREMPPGAVDLPQERRDYFLHEPEC